MKNIGDLVATKLNIDKLVRVTVLVVASTFPVTLLSNDEKIDRRNFFTKIRDAYIQGRYEKNEQRIADRKEAEKMRRRAVRERNIRTLIDGVSRRLKRGPSYIKVSVFLGVGLVVWLCHKGSVGCDGKEDKQRMLLNDYHGDD